MLIFEHTALCCYLVAFRLLWSYRHKKAGWVMACFKDGIK